jgi:sugar/nucleoside kinase (ribokinase family)
VDALVIGPYYCDLVYAGLPRMPEPGEEVWAKSCSVLPGGAYITAAALHRLGASCAWATSFGTDPFSRYVLSEARLLGLDEVAFTITDEPLPNISVSLSFGPDRSFVSFGKAYTGDPARLVDCLRPRILVRPGLGSISEAMAWLDLAHEAGAIMYLDPQSTSHRIDTDGMRTLIDRVDVFAPNEREALSITGASSLGEAVDGLRGAASLIVIKQGKEGALAVRGPHIAWAPALPIEAIETTGAGDCFNAGFITAMLEGASMAECLDVGNASGGLSTLAPSSQGVPTRAAVDAARSRSDWSSIVGHGHAGIDDGRMT